MLIKVDLIRKQRPIPRLSGTTIIGIRYTEYSTSRNSKQKQNYHVPTIMKYNDEE